MRTLITVAFVVYLVVCEFFDAYGRLEIIKSRFPWLYKAMSNRQIRLVLLLFLIALTWKCVIDRAKGKMDVPPLVVNLLAPPAPVVQMCATTGSDPNTSINQTVVENQGQITGGQINGNTLISGTDKPGRQVGVHVGKAFSGSTPNITATHMCFGDDWKCFLQEAEAHAQKRDVGAFDELVHTFNHVVDARVIGHPDQAQQCHEEVNDAVSLLRANMKDESAIVKTLLSRVPICFRKQ